MSQTKKAPARFTVGDKVRVRTGVTDPDFSDIPLGGWAGKITEVEQGGRTFRMSLRRCCRSPARPSGNH